MDREYKTPAKAPGAQPLIGHLPLLMNDPPKAFLKLSEMAPEISVVSIPASEFLFLNSAQSVGQVLGPKWKSFRKSDFYSLLKPIFGEGLAIAEGEEWRRQRMSLQAGFSQDSSQQLKEEAVRILLEETSHIRHGMHIDLWSLSGFAAAGAAAKTLFGLDAFQIRKVIEQFIVACRHLLMDFEKKVWAPIVPSDIPGTPARKKFIKAKNMLDNAIDEIIAVRKKMPAGNDILYSLISNNDPVVRNQVAVLLTTSYETTTTTVCWLMRALGDNPEIDQKSREDQGYFEAVILESMRYRPSVWTISRTATEDVILGDWLIKKGATVMASPWIMHMSNKYWEDPEVFKPERFLTDKIPVPGSYIPFSGGARACMARKSASPFVGAITAALRDKFRFIPVEKAEPVAALGLKADVDEIFEAVSVNSSQITASELIKKPAVLALPDYEDEIPTGPWQKGRVTRFTLDDGKKVVIKRPAKIRNPYFTWERETAAYALLSQNKPGIIPEIHGIANESADPRIVMEDLSDSNWVEAIHISDWKIEDLHAIAALVADFHEITVPEDLSLPVWGDAKVLSMTADALDEAGNILYQNMPDIMTKDNLDVLQQVSAVLPYIGHLLNTPDNRRSLAHGDFRSTNIMLKNNTAKAIDWEYSAIGSLWADLARFASNTFDTENYATFGRQLMLAASVYLGEDEDIERWKAGVAYGLVFPVMSLKAILEHGSQNVETHITEDIISCFRKSINAIQIEGLPYISKETTWAA